MFRDTTEISSSRPTYRDTRRSARYELSEWDRDFWEEYSVKPEGADYESDDEDCDSDGNEKDHTRVYDEKEGFVIEASSSEGETFTVGIKKKEVSGKPKSKPLVKEAPVAIVRDVPVNVTLPSITSMNQRVGLGILETNTWASRETKTSKKPTRKCRLPCHAMGSRQPQWRRQSHRHQEYRDMYEKAKKAASRILLDEHDRDWFEQYQMEETAKEPGGFEVWARCPEGEVFPIYIEEEPMPMTPWTPVTKTMYTTVSKTTGGAYELCQDVVFESLLDTNKAVWALLGYGISDNHYSDPKENEKNALGDEPQIVT